MSLLFRLLPTLSRTTAPPLPRRQLPLPAHGLIGATPLQSLLRQPPTLLFQTVRLTHPQTLLHPLPLPPAAPVPAPDQVRLWVTTHPRPLAATAKLHLRPQTAAQLLSSHHQSQSHLRHLHPVRQLASAALSQAGLGSLRSSCVMLRKTRHQTSPPSFTLSLSVAFENCFALPVSHERRERRRWRKRGLVLSLQRLEELKSHCVNICDRLFLAARPREGRAHFNSSLFGFGADPEYILLMICNLSSVFSSYHAGHVFRLLQCGHGNLLLCDAAYPCLANDTARPKLEAVSWRRSSKS